MNAAQAPTDPNSPDWVWGEHNDPWGRDPSDRNYMCTPLVPVKDWGWHRYTVRYWRDEEHYNTGLEPLLERECIESERSVDRWLCYGEGEEPEGGWPAPRYGSGTRPGWVSWEVAESNVERLLRFAPSPYGGTQAHGSGWLADAPYNWDARGKGY